MEIWQWSGWSFDEIRVSVCVSSRFLLDDVEADVALFTTCTLISVSLHRGTWLGYRLYAVSRCCCCYGRLV